MYNFYKNIFNAMHNLFSKIILILLMLFSLHSTESKAQIQNYRATSYAYKYVSSSGYWTDWSDWINCNISVVMNLNTDRIFIYSKKTQIYVVVVAEDAYRDASGGYQVPFKVIDQDGDRGTLRLRVDPSGTIQLYVDFADIRWVYNLTGNSYY